MVKPRTVNPSWLLIPQEMASIEVGITIFKPFIYEEKNYVYPPCCAFISRSAVGRQGAESHCCCHIKHFLLN